MKKNKNYGIDIIDELTSILSNELAKEVDKNILSTIISMGVEPRNKRRINSIDKIFKSSE